jgi:endogenous inhibitor of DNA gyrase (YacG/DUF329 family)
MDKVIKENLEWLVGFSQADLGNLTPGDRAKMAVEAGEYLLPREKEFGDGVLPPKPQWAKDLPQKDTPEFWGLLAHLQKVVWRMVSSISEDGREYETWKRQPKPSGGFFAWTGQAHFVFSGHETFAFSYVPITKDVESFLQMKFYSTLNGLPRFTILRCPECKKIFVNPSRKNRIFCSSQCGWRFGMRKWRSEKKEEFPEEQKKRLVDL